MWSPTSQCHIKSSLVEQQNTTIVKRLNNLASNRIALDHIRWNQSVNEAQQGNRDASFSVARAADHTATKRHHDRRLLLLDACLRLSSTVIHLETLPVVMYTKCSILVALQFCGWDGLGNDQITTNRFSRSWWCQLSALLAFSLAINYVLVDKISGYGNKNED